MWIISQFELALPKWNCKINIVSSCCLFPTNSVSRRWIDRTLEPWATVMQSRVWQRRLNDDTAPQSEQINQLESNVPPNQMKCARALDSKIQNQLEKVQRCLRSTLSRKVMLKLLLHNYSPIWKAMEHIALYGVCRLLWMEKKDEEPHMRSKYGN